MKKLSIINDTMIYSIYMEPGHKVSHDERNIKSQKTKPKYLSSAMLWKAGFPKSKGKKKYK